MSTRYIYRLAVGLITLITALWTFWGTTEVFYEGWGQPLSYVLPYLIPALACLALALVAVTWPLVGGTLILVVGVVFTAWWWGMPAFRGELTWSALLGMLPVSALLVILGVLFLLEGRQRRLSSARGRAAPSDWFARNWHYLVVVGAPLLVVAGISVHCLPILLVRVDDGFRDARLIQGNGVALVWAPEGPGWNWRQSWGGYPSWNSLALYGATPLGLSADKGQASAEDMQATGLCRYLDAGGLLLLETPQDIWRMPQVDEILRSLALHGTNAGCAWNGGVGQMHCSILPDKETPVWAPDQAPIYYWTAGENGDEAYYVSYEGAVYSKLKDWSNPRHGYRCVREP